MLLFLRRLLKLEDRLVLDGAVVLLGAFAFLLTFYPRRSLTMESGTTTTTTGNQLILLPINRQLLLVRTSAHLKTERAVVVDWTQGS